MVEREFKMKTNKSYITVQENFIKREIFVLNLLKFFFDNKREVCGKMSEHFSLIFSDEVKKQFQYDTTTPDYVWEFLEDIAYTIEYGHTNYNTNKKYYICIVGNGIFSVLHLTTNRKKRLKLDDAIKWSDFSNFEGF
jgi:hypothetical protein